MSHEHRYVGFNSGGKTVQHCQSCFQIRPDEEPAPPPASVEVPASTEASDTGSQEPESDKADEETGESSGQPERGSGTLRRNSRYSSRRTDG